MCGITGFIDPAGATPEPARVLRAMRDALTHRGPDDAGEVIVAPVWLAHRRLSIVAPGPEGRQPFVSRGPDGAVEVVALANGEIYDHETHRARIAACWPEAAELPASDCAVLPCLWRLERERLPCAIRGMFAIAAWDVRQEVLLLARDAAGQKPLYWATLPGGGLAFASEPKALLRHPAVGREIDPIALRRYLTFDYVPGEATIYRGIRRLPPGGRLLWQQGCVQVDSWYRIPSGEPPLASGRDAADALWQAFGDAVEARLMADVPLGVFLSGGLDSTAVVAALAERMDPGALRTFSIGFADPTFDESHAARTVAQHFGTKHHERRLDAASLIEMVPDILGVLDEPFADPSIVPTWLLAGFTREHVKVALGGDGGDELLLGYPTFYAERVARWAARLPRALRAGVLEPLAARLPASTRYMSLDFKLRRFLSGLDLPPDHRHPTWVGGVPSAHHRDALHPDLLAAAPDDTVFADVDAIGQRFRAARPGADVLDRLAWQYFHTYLADGVLAKVDRATMAHGLEARAPFCDPAVVATAARIPVRHKLRGTTTKKILRDLLRERGVPREILALPKKGFGIPVGAWLRGPLRGWMEEVLAPERIRAGGLLRAEWVRRLIDEHVAGAANHRKPLWSAIALELWRTGPQGPGAAGA